VDCELHEEMKTAISREKQLEKRRRACKLELIERQNPGWRDLWDEFALPVVPPIGVEGRPLTRE